MTEDSFTSSKCFFYAHPTPALAAHPAGAGEAGSPLPGGQGVPARAGWGLGQSEPQMEEEFGPDTQRLPPHPTGAARELGRGLAAACQAPLPSLFGTVPGAVRLLSEASPVRHALWGRGGISGSAGAPLRSAMTLKLHPPVGTLMGTGHWARAEGRISGTPLSLHHVP